MAASSVKALCALLILLAAPGCTSRSPQQSPPQPPPARHRILVFGDSLALGMGASDSAHGFAFVLYRAVLARDPHIADAAAQLIAADYEELPAVFDEVEAAANKILVHDELRPAGTFADLKHLKGRRDTNVALDFKLRRGDIDAPFARAAHVFEPTFRTQTVVHAALEPIAASADWKENGLTIYTASQGPSFVRTEIARLIGWPENRVRIKVPYLGGGFGGKLYIKLEALATALSMIARRPVKVALSMEEQFYTITKHPSTFRIKTGLDKTGRITAPQCEGQWHGGGHDADGPPGDPEQGSASSERKIIMVIA